MRVIEVNAGTLKPVDAQQNWGVSTLVCRCLIVDLGGQVVLVDTGIGLADIAEPRVRLGDPWIAMARPVLDPNEALVNQLPSLGFTTAQVTDIVLTHQHRDHVGGLADFPHSRVHVHPGVRNAVTSGVGDEREAGVRAQWAHGVRWAPRPVPSLDWRGLPTSTLDGVDSAIRLVELPGHARGHSGVLIERPDHLPLLHVGDAAFHPSQYGIAHVPPAVTAFAETTEHDRHLRIQTEHALTRLAADPNLQIITSHGPAA